MTKFIAYYRVSRDKQGETGLGMEAQQNRVRAHVAGVKGEIAGEYTEVESGRSVTRPQLLVAIAKAQEIGATLIVAKLDRMARNLSYFLKIIDSGLPVTFCDLPHVPDGVVGRFLLQQIASIAELECGLIRERTRAALQALKSRGKKLGTHGLVLARRRRKEARERAKVIRHQVQMIEGKDITQLTIKEVTEILNARSLFTPNGKMWKHATTQRMLQRLRTAD